LLSVADLSAAETEGLIAKALDMKRQAAPQSLFGKVLVLLLQKALLAELFHQVGRKR